MKKLISLLLILVLSVTMLAACSKKHECAKCGGKFKYVYRDAELGDEAYCKDCYIDLVSIPGGVLD